MKPEVEQKQKSKKAHKNQRKVKGEKLIVGSSYEPNDVVEEDDQPQQQRQHVVHGSGKKRSEQGKQDRKSAQPHERQNDATSFQDGVTANYLFALFEEEGLCQGCYVRKFMDEAGKVKVSDLAKLLQLTEETIRNAMKIGDLQEHIVLVDDGKAIQLKNNPLMFVLPEGDRIKELKDNDVAFHRKKLWKWIWKNTGKISQRKPQQH